jgi:hypothetical protein
MKINRKLRGKLPRVEPPVPWQTKHGLRTGWKVTIPGRRPLATPAVADGRLFLGGGFGSYDFYALDAASGQVLWQYQTEDDGPTAAVVHEGHVAFNTESCELEVLDTAGRRLWKQWLGDPLMSMPAMDDGRVYQVYPDSQGDRRHYLAAFDLADGRQLWKQPLPGEIITAPVLAEGHVTSPTWTGRSPASARTTARSSGRRRRAPPHRPWSGRGSATLAGARRCWCPGAVPRCCSRWRN